MFNVFADYHHTSLYHSLHILFEKRLGGTLYRPLGNEWLDGGYWLMATIYNNHPLTVAQYLGVRPDYLNPSPGHYLAFDPEYNYDHNAITVGKFMALPIDFVIATIPAHIPSFYQLAQDHPNKPKVIFQVGNAWEIDPAQPIKNIMASALLPNHPSGFNIVEYHQEFDLSVFAPQPTTDSQTITSFINCYQSASLYKHDWETFTRVEKLMPSWQFKSLGGSCRDGAANGQKILAELMGRSRFVWHAKSGGDGYGHIIHNAYAMGIPPIVVMQYYAGKLAGQLMRDGETCIAIDGLSTDGIIAKINHYNEPAHYEAMRKNVYNVFKQTVDFDRDAENIRQFLTKSL